MSRRWKKLQRVAIAPIALVAVLLLTTQASATNGMQVIGIGPIMRSMGGAGSALPLDAAIVLVNPAAMSELDGRFDFGMTLFVPDSDFTATHIPAFGGTTVSEDSDTGPSPIPAIGFVIPVNERINFGMGAYGIAGMGVDYPTSLYNNVVYSSFEMMKFAPGLSYKVNDRLSLGLALNLDYATMGFEAGGDPAHDKNSQYGLGFEAGIYYRPTEKFSVALSYISKQRFNDFEFNTTGGRDEMDLDLPRNVILGLAYRMTPRLRVAADVKWIQWSDTMGQDQPEYTENNSGSTPWNTDWDDQWVFMIGAEYDITDHFRWRVGYNYGENPLNRDRAFEGIAFPAIQEHHFTTGFTYDVNDDLGLNVGFMYAPEVEMDGSNPAQGIADYETSLSEYSIDFGFSYKF